MCKLKWNIQSYIVVSEMGGGGGGIGPPAPQRLMPHKYVAYRESFSCDRS